MSTFAPINPNYIVDQDGGVAFESDILDMSKPTSAINWQLKWSAGVKGVFIWEASIYPEPQVWETLVACEEVQLLIESGVLSSIVALPHQWLTTGFVRFRFVPSAGSVGLIQAAIRIVPI